MRRPPKGWQPAPPQARVHADEPWYSLRLTDDIRGRHVEKNFPRALAEMIDRQTTNSEAARFRMQRAWRALTLDEQFQSWQQRGQTAASGSVTLWEQYASATEAHERARLLHHGPTYTKLLYAPYVEVERVPAEHEARAGGRYAYRAWHEESMLDGYVRTATVPRDPAVARDLDDLLDATRRVPLTTPWYRVFVYTEDTELRQDLRARGIDLGPRFSEELSQQRRQFYTLEAQHAVRQARSTRDWIEADWHDLTPGGQQAAYERAGQGDRATVWEERLAAHLKLARREQMIPYASQGRSDLPDAFVEVEGKDGRDAPYRITRWTRIWDADLGLTRFEREPVQRAPTMEVVVDLTQNGRTPIFADALGMRATLRQHGLEVVQQEHLVAQRPQLERRYERERAYALGD